MTDFGVEQPIEDTIDQRTDVDDDRPVMPPPAPGDEADWEASEADVAEQQMEIPLDDPRDEPRG